MVSKGSWKDYGLTISSRQIGFDVFKNSTENTVYKICNLKPSNKNLKYTVTDSRGKILKNSNNLDSMLRILIGKINWLIIF